MSREVEKGKEEDPDDIDKMPVETGNFDRHVAPVSKRRFQVRKAKVSRSKTPIRTCTACSPVIAK
jgi:hypothetical protein